ncbi:UDP-N-acetylmuramoyl-L-alanine--D-glutamate ligase [Bacillus timonensis]|nr:UDP-N-acetylmuramoyl-L-alanine--D-glutamate ligase [Bacillus timonensis]
MKNIERFHNKKVLVLGLAKSGLASAMVLNRVGAIVTVNDQKPIDENESAQNLQKQGIKVICGGHPISILDDHFDFIVKNPGIPYTNPLLVKAVELNIPIITEIELAYYLTDAEFIGITGSNGKTTTTTLIYEMLQVSNKHPLIAGNIGTVACEVAEKAQKENVIVTELSSFQLMGIQDFKPKVSVLLNIFDAHLDYHGTKEHYISAKSRIFENQTNEDSVVLNANDSVVLAAAQSTKAQKVLFSSASPLKEGAYVSDGHIYFNEEKIMPLNEVALPGVHNLENILAAVAVAKLIGSSNDAICHVLKTFTGVKHRLQYVTTINGRKFYNDSKATNILATQKAITAFEQPVILLAGGLDRGNSFDALLPQLKNVQSLVCFGQTANKLMDAGKSVGIETIKHVDNVEQAVKVAFEISNNGDIILLSPACASWDQYKTFEERGDIFIDAVHKLK